MSIDWDTFSKTLGYAGEKEMWEKLYSVEGLSISQLCARLNVSRNTIRERLRSQGVEARSRGGANFVKKGITDEVVKKAMEHGVATVAAEIGVEYNTLYKRVKKAKGSQSPTSDSVPPAPPTEEKP